MEFKIGDKVLHPQHGVGTVSDMEIKQIRPDVYHTYYVIKIRDFTLWVPIELTTSGLRKLCSKKDIEQCRQILQSAPQELKQNRGLLPDLKDRIRQGTVFAFSEVVRDLAAFAWQKTLSGPVGNFQRSAMSVLSQEWGAVEGLSEEDTTHEIRLLLKNGKAVHEH